MDTPSTTQAGQWMRNYVAETLSRADLERFIDKVGRSMGADVPELSTDAEIQRDLQLAVRSEFRLILVVRRADADPSWSVPVADEARSLARTIARRGLELRILSQLCHAGHRAVWRLIDPDLVPPGIRVAVGRPGQGIDGFRRTHREAQAAQQIATRAQRGQSVTGYRDVELVSMLASRPDAMDTLVERELHGLLGEDEPSARLRETLGAVLSHHGNVEAAARQLGVHKNTVRYRVQQIEERLGRRVNHRTLHLELALDYLDTFGGRTDADVSTGQNSRGTLDN